MSDTELTPPARGFAVAEFEQRLSRVQGLMHAAKVDALLLNTEPEVRYFSGFLSEFWYSPTRPWYLIVPSDGKPIAIVPQIGAAGMSATWLDDVRSWPAPRPEDDGISLLVPALGEVSTKNGRIALLMGHETHLRMPYNDTRRLMDELSHRQWVDGTPIIKAVRGIKSEAEIDKIRYACRLTSHGYNALPSGVAHGQTERAIVQTLKKDLLERGADGSPFMVGGSGRNGYDNIIVGPTERQLSEGDILIIDTGTLYDGYFCDFDRNFAFGEVSDDAKRAYDTVYQATEAGIRAARPGATASDLWAAMWKVLENGGALGEDVGRQGHGLGMQLTEWPSNMPSDKTVMEPGMVMTIEPGMCFAPGKLMVHEENIVIRDGEAELLTIRAYPEMPVISS